MPLLIRRVFDRPLGAFAACWPLALLAPFVPGLPRLAMSGLSWRQEFALALLCLFTLLASRRRARAACERLLHTSREELYTLAPLLLFACWSAASISWAESVYPALHHTLSWGLYVLFFALMRRAAGSPRLLRATLATLAVVFVITGASSLIGFWSGAGTQVGYNGLGEPYAVAAPFFAALAMGVRARRAAWLCGAAAVLSWATVLQSAERSPFIAAGVALLALVVACASSRRLMPRRSPRRALALAFAFALVTVLYNLPTPVTQDERPSVVARLTATHAEEANTRARFLLWGVALEMFRAHPVRGVGANNYEVAFPAARVEFNAGHVGSPLVQMNEAALAQRAHNEYLQILSELGAVGFALFAAFALALMRAALLALGRARGPLVPAAFAGLIAFALSSGASSVSFRWMGSGLLFFFMAALVSRRAEGATVSAEAPTIRLARAHTFCARAAAATLALAVVLAMGAQAASIMLQAAAQGSADQRGAESFYRSALRLNPYDVPARYDFGMWLYARGREREAVPHLRYAVERGFNSVVCYAYLAGAEANSGDLLAAERTLRFAARVYPRSVFIGVRHAAALERLGDKEAARVALREATEEDARSARGWYELIYNDVDAAVAAARRDPRVPMPGELLPPDGVFAVLQENEKRFPQSAATGWRARVRAAAGETK